MKTWSACIIAIGSEITRGIIQDTNSHWLASKLTSIGVVVKRIIAVPDEKEEIAWALRSCLEVADIVVSTGGLGYTSDDITIPAIAETLGLRRVFSREVYETVKAKLRGKIPEHIEVIYPPEGARPLVNPIGVSPGFHLVFNNKHIFILPGVPAEMKSIFEENIIPELNKLVHLYTRTIVVKTRHQVEAEVDKLLEPIREKYKWAYIKTHAKKPVEVTIQIHGESKEDLERRIEMILNEIKATLEVEEVVLY